MMIHTALAYAAIAVVNDPQTVNSIVIGPAADYTTRGPATVCLDKLTVEAKPGEEIVLDYSGIHVGSLILKTYRGDVRISAGDAFAPLSGTYRDYFDRRGRQRVYRTVDDEKQPVYKLIPREDPTATRHSPAIIISGRGIRGSEQDRGIIDRIRWGENLDRCQRTYNYGWGVLFGDEPLSVTKTSEQP